MKGKSALIFLFIPALGCTKTTESLQDAISASGCESPKITITENIYNAESAKCADGSRVYWFPTKEANENHSQGCKQFGGKPIKSGDNWTMYLPSC